MKRENDAGRAYHCDDLVGDVSEVEVEGVHLVPLFVLRNQRAQIHGWIRSQRCPQPSPLLLLSWRPIFRISSVGRVYSWTGLRLLVLPSTTAKTTQRPVPQCRRQPMAKFLISHLFVVCGKAWARPRQDEEGDGGQQHHGSLERGHYFKGGKSIFTAKNANGCGGRWLRR